MKKNYIVAFAAIICVSYSCKEMHKEMMNEPSTADKYKASNAIIYKAIETGDMSKIDSIIPKDAIDHAGMNGKDVVGLDSIKAELAPMHTMFKNLKMEVLSSATDGAYSMERVRMTGTALVQMDAFTPPGTNVDMTSLEVVKWKDGKAVEHWTYMDSKDVAKMMAPPPPAPKKMDKK